MQRNYKLFLKDMLLCAQKVQRYTQDLSYDHFSNDELVIDATVRNLEIIGEAAKNIPEAMRKEHPDLPWREMARFRDVLIHHYFGVRLETVWDVVQNEIPALLVQLETILATTGSKDIQ